MVFSIGFGRSTSNCFFFVRCSFSRSPPTSPSIVVAVTEMVRGSSIPVKKRHATLDDLFCVSLFYDLSSFV